MDEASQALQKIARGTGIVFAGTVVSMQSISDVTLSSESLAVHGGDAINHPTTLKPPKTILNFGV